MRAKVDRPPAGVEQDHLRQEVRQDVVIQLRTSANRQGAITVGLRLQDGPELVEHRYAELSAPMLVEDLDPTGLPFMAQLVHGRRDHEVGQGLHRNARLVRAVDQRTNRVSFPSLERGQQLLREGFRIEATLRLGDEPKLA